MPCAEPVPVWRAANGGPLSFATNAPRDGRAYYKSTVPCGTCILCRGEQARQWAIRIHHESQLHTTNSFLTLTYNDENLPPHNSLQYKDVQKFWKRLRKALQHRIRYYAVGEYGSKTLRPHYHACVFGEDFTKDAKMVQQHPHPLWDSPMLTKAWGMGGVRVGQLNHNTAQYTASYVVKKLRSKQQYVRIDVETGELIPLEQPRCYTSLAIAKDWLAKYGNQVYAHDYVVINGKRQKPPKYYDRWLGKRSKIALSMIQQQREEKYEPETEEQTRARAQNAHAHAKTKSQKL